MATDPSATLPPMAGSINLSLSQQFDKLNGNLLSGGRLYFYAAGTDSPQNAFKDTGLTLVHPNPIILASDGRVPQLYLADGSIHVRLTDNAGVVQFDEDFVLVIGPSSGGGGGGGGGVDPFAIWQTGDIQWQPTAGDRSGWVISNGVTIGNVSSGAHYHTAQHQPLFEYLWNTYTDAYCPVVGGRGGLTSANGWTGGKQIATLDFREIITGGMSGMGNVARGGFNGLPIERGDWFTPAGIIGEINHTLSVAELAAHNHTGTTDGNNVDHTHGIPNPGATTGSVSGNAAGGGSGNIWFGSGSTNSGGESNPHTHTFTTSTVGSSAAHNNTPRIMVGTFYQKM